MLTAERSSRTFGWTRLLYRLSEPTTTAAMPGVEFEHIVLSFGLLGDTCAFPADGEGRIISLVGFGFGIGPSRWLAGDEFDSYVRDCITQHEKDGGAGLHPCFDWPLPAEEENDE